MATLTHSAMKAPLPHAANVLLSYDVCARQRLVARTGHSTASTAFPSAATNAEADASTYVALADGLAHELEPLMHRELPIPRQKARLTRHGGRCPVHGTLLLFDPYAPNTHHCVSCQIDYTGREHDDWWAMGAQLWTAERAVHAAALYAVRGNPQHEQLAMRILHQYVQRYASWPNTDNVLGPTRLFFSTYLESIWLLNICHAVALLESTSTAWEARDAIAVRQQIIAPSAALIASYAEGRSNRQVWNEVAILSAWRMLGDDTRVRRRLQQAGGLCSLIDLGLLEDGTWYEGENYHLFAHRGLWYGVQLMRAMQEPLPMSLEKKYAEGFVAPFLGVLPDDTFPSRRDSQYASSIRQWRTAEWCELGWAHTEDPRLAGILARMYAAPSRRDQRSPRESADNVHHAHRGNMHTGRATSTADAERNHPATPLSRADLSWRALLMGSETLPAVEPWHAGSTFLPSQGLAIIKRDDGQTYVALEGGELGGGHGHPDQLALTLQTNASRWLQDPGTGSYTSPDLFWYRSTMAHFAPYVGMASQLPHAAVTHAYCDEGDFGWMTKAVDQLAVGVNVQRSVVVADGYLIDMVAWQSVEGNAVDFTLPIAGEATVLHSTAHAKMHSTRQINVAEGATYWRNVPDSLNAAIPNATQSFFRETVECDVVGTVEIRVPPQFAIRRESGMTPVDVETNETRRFAELAHVTYAASSPTVLRRSQVPGVPGKSATHQHRLVCHASSGTIVGVWRWPNIGESLVNAVRFESLSTDHVQVQVDVLAAHGSVSHRHTRVAEGWQVEVTNTTNTETETTPAHRTILLPQRHHEVASSSSTQRTSDNTPALSAPFNAFERAILTIPCVADTAITGLPGSTIDGAYTQMLEGPHYVQTEQSWAEAGFPRAVVQVACSSTEFVVDVSAHTGTPIVSPLEIENPLDNERSAVNCDGVQWYMANARAVAPSLAADVWPHAQARWDSAAIHVPSNATPSDHAGYAEPLVGATVLPITTWRLMPGGWAMRLTWPRAALPLNEVGEWIFELVVNECVAERERRRGQLVLSGGGGFGYLAGDRRTVLGAVVFRLASCVG